MLRTDDECAAVSRPATTARPTKVATDGYFSIATGSDLDQIGPAGVR
jgi:hypothetical protein